MTGRQRLQRMPTGRVGRGGVPPARGSLAALGIDPERVCLALSLTVKRVYAGDSEKG